MKKGTKVRWITGNGIGVPPTVGHGVTISEEEDSKILVAVHSMGEMHHVIHCNTTWLTIED